MGGASSKTTATQITNQLMSVVTQAVAKADNTYTGANIINLSGNCKIQGSTISQKNYIKLSTKITQDVSSSTEVKQSLAQKVQQISQAETPNFSFTKAESETFTNLISNLSTAIQQNVGAGCSQVSTQINLIDCSQDASIQGSFILQEQVGEYLFECSQKVSSIVTAQQDLQTFIDQHSSAKVFDIIVPIMIMAAVLGCLFIFGPKLAGLIPSADSSSGGAATYLLVAILAACSLSSFVDCVSTKFFCKDGAAILMWGCSVIMLGLSGSLLVSKFKS
ncbi:MAG: hypothetical protein Harvfovirus77_2 [Harvfovirus sp.]|uniref:Uncharacterized protein n=1 Tax=Harvfovirus sp. TaxID=2487768 RepID=A0A3G5A3X9_9VIRU|nr:MAG: hypothetical protein Harvfovirus77_2 [Harvfovirus sp.]